MNTRDIIRRNIIEQDELSEPEQIELEAEKVLAGIKEYMNTLEIKLNGRIKGLKQAIDKNDNKEQEKKVQQINMFMEIAKDVLKVLEDNI